ncbi:Serine protease 1 [Operophtera brumata]|uniref:Serine protease 1 n=1 Tax=Operophtera brumata TaxID=104452 RepID=A0A0L7LAA9_OPEBR|nr:Serine protease 1 [Operophtera brumata]
MFRSDTAVCKGDAGGGLVFAEAERDGSQRHYLRGIVSIAPASETACNTATYTAFTHIRKHEDFLRKFVVEMRNKWKLSQIVAIRLG